MGFVVGALRLVPLIFAAVSAVEKLAGARKGKDKQDAAVALVGDLLPIVEGAIGRDVVDDAQVQDAMRTTIDAIVALLNATRTVGARRAVVAAAPDVA